MMRAGLLSGRDVCGDRLPEVLWYPSGRYALFPLYIPGKPDIPCEPPPLSKLFNLAWPGRYAFNAWAPKAELPFPRISPRGQGKGGGMGGRQDSKAQG